MALLGRTVQKILGLQHLRRLFSRPELAASAEPRAAEGEAGAEEGGAEPLAAEGSGTAGAALASARAALGLPTGALLTSPSGAAAAAVGARGAARRLRKARLIALPRWLLMPSELQQHWVRYTLLGIGAGYTTLFFYR